MASVVRKLFGGEHDEQVEATETTSQAERIAAGVKKHATLRLAEAEYRAATARLSATRTQIRQLNARTVTASELHVVERELAGLDRQIAKLSAEVGAARRAILDERLEHIAAVTAALRPLRLASLDRLEVALHAVDLAISELNAAEREIRRCGGDSSPTPWRLSDRDEIEARIVRHRRALAEA